MAQCLLLVSCAGSNFLANIYIFSYSATDSANRASQPSQLDIRVGYFFFCAKTEQDTSWICGSGDYTRQHLIGHTDSHSILRAAYDLQNEAISSSMKYRTPPLISQTSPSSCTNLLGCSASSHSYQHSSPSPSSPRSQFSEARIRMSPRSDTHGGSFASWQVQ